MALKEDALIVAGVAVALVGLVWYTKNKIGQAAGSAADGIKKAAGQVWDAAAEGTKYVDPTREENVANQLFTGSLRAIGVLGQNDTVGSKAYDGVQELGKRADALNKAAADARDEGETYGWQI
jgi:hypothetical protein